LNTDTSHYYCYYDYYSYDYYYCRKKEEIKQLVAKAAVLNNASGRVIALFRELDMDGSGELDAFELRKLVTGTGVEFGPEEFDRFFEFIDADGSGEISIKEFTDAVRTLTSQGKEEEEAGTGEQEDDWKVAAYGMKVFTAQTGIGFGELSLLEGAPRTATIIAGTNLSVLTMTKDDFDEIGT
jgi:CRP-like cAMP-binding protein